MDISKLKYECSKSVSEVYGVRIGTILEWLDGREVIGFRPLRQYDEWLTTDGRVVKWADVCPSNMSDPRLIVAPVTKTVTPYLAIVVFKRGNCRVAVINGVTSSLVSVADGSIQRDEIHHIHKLADLKPF